jgi:hypothetical protein
MRTKRLDVRINRLLFVCFMAGKLLGPQRWERMEYDGNELLWYHNGEVIDKRTTKAIDNSHLLDFKYIGFKKMYNKLVISNHGHSIC